MPEYQHPGQADHQGQDQAVQPSEHSLRRYLINFYGPGALAALVAGGLVSIKVSPDAVNYAAGAVVQGAVAAEGVRYVGGRLRSRRNEDLDAGIESQQVLSSTPSRRSSLIRKGTAATAALAGGLAAYRLSPEPEFLRTTTSMVGEGAGIYLLGGGAVKVAIFASNWVGDIYTGIQVKLGETGERWSRKLSERFPARHTRRRRQK